MEILKIKNLNKSFGKKKILKNVSFNVNEGDILGFIGPNGAGKTTTIKMILGLQSIDSGTVTINGYDIKKNFEKAKRRLCGGHRAGRGAHHPQRAGDRCPHGSHGALG